MMLLCSGMAHSQEVVTDISVNFRVNNAVIDTSFFNNQQSIEKIKSFLQYIEQNPDITLKQVMFCGSTSPEGSDRLNRNLAKRRLQALERCIRHNIAIPDSVIARNDSYIPWNMIEKQVAESDMQYKEEVLAILRKEAKIVSPKSGYSIDNRVIELQRLRGGRVWRELLDNYFSSMRHAYAILVTDKPIPEDITPTPEEEVVEPEPVVSTPEPVEEPKPIASWQRHLYFKTNTLTWAGAIANVAMEVDLGKHWSLSVPVYYSGWNYFKSDIKFRMLGTQPEVRYWFSENNDRFFVGTHFGVASYNLAVAGKYRLQDHNGKTPALGGGINTGYRLPISKNNRWKLEFSLGAGAYALHYDKFDNSDSTTTGKLIKSVKKVYYGLDNASVSFAYTFDLNKKGGAQ